MNNQANITINQINYTMTLSDCVMANSPEVVEFIAAAQKLRDDWEAEIQIISEKEYGITPVPFVRTSVITAIDLQKFVKIIITDNQEKVWGFIAKFDFSSKALGNIKRGDILKAANFKSPAKGNRGNLFDDSKGLSRINWYGPMYLDEK
jgi:hypothetical protein